MYKNNRVQADRSVTFVCLVHFEANKARFCHLDSSRPYLHTFVYYNDTR